MVNRRKCLTLAALLFVSNVVSALDLTELTVEEKRIDKAIEAMPKVTSRLDSRVKQFETQIVKAKNYTALTEIVIRHGSRLWTDAVMAFSEDGNYEDRSLYWARLKMAKALRLAPAFKALYQV